MLVDIAYPSPRAGRWSAALALPRGRRRSLGASAALHSRACACALRRARTDGGAASIHAQKSRYGGMCLRAGAYRSIWGQPGHARQAIGRGEATHCLQCMAVGALLVELSTLRTLTW